MKMLMFTLHIILIHLLFVADAAAGPPNVDKSSKREKYGKQGAAHLSSRQRLPSTTTTNDPTHTYGVTIKSPNRSSNPYDEVKLRLGGLGYYEISDIHDPLKHHVEQYINPDINRPITKSTFDDDFDGQSDCTLKCEQDYFLCNQSCECHPISMKCEKEIYCEDSIYEHDCVLHNANLAEDIKSKCENVTGHIMCPNTYICIAEEWLCDGDDDCGDYSDETRCGSSANCTHDQFECKNGLCIHNLWVCDGDNDCTDYSDEVNCTKLSCTTDEFQCENGDCVSASFQCNGEFDCIDHTDENDCGDKTSVCPEGEFRCKGTNGGVGGVGGGPGCILNRFRCDGDNDCGDWSDEDGCISLSTTCAAKEFKCADGKCISLDWKCDMQKDCDKGEDEKNCETVDQIKKVCKNDEFKCTDGRCILKSWICDGVPDCKNLEDEIKCPVHCEIGQFTCESPTNYTRKELCVNQKHICDGYKDCPLGDDETKCPFYETCELNSTCEHFCTVLDSVKGCDCKVGFVLNKNKQNCDDIDECQYSMNPVCSQVCINTMGSYRCDCLDGYILRPDLRTCKAMGSGVNLLMANRNDIRQVSLNTNKYTSLVKGLHNVIAIDYHYKKGLLFWSDISTDVIKMSSINGSNIKDVIKWGLESPGGIAIDWIHDLVFWTDSETRRIEVSNFDGTLRSVVIADNIYKPRAIVVHPGEAALFWTDWGSDFSTSSGPNSKIEKSCMDGSNRIILAKDDIYWPNGLVIDYPANRIYWADAKHHVIESMKLDGKDRKKILSKHLPHPFALTLFEDVLFWTDWHTKTISSAHKVTGNGYHSIHYTLHFPMDIHSYHESRQPLFPNHCALDKIGLKGGCSHMCLPNKINRSCVCPIGLTLNDDRTTCTTVPDKFLLVTRRKDIRLNQIKKNNIDVDMVIPLDSLKSAVAVDWCSKTDLIYWTDVGRSAINRANFNGSNQECIIDTNLESPAGLAMDWVTDKLYWTDPGPKRIEVSSIDGKQRAVLIWKGLDKPRDIVVHPSGGIMFWSDWGTTPLIECADMDGQNRKVIVKNDLLWPNGLAIDYINYRLYFADGGTRSIEYVHFDGTHRTKVLTAKDGLAHPFGLDVYDNSIYWIDWETHSLDMMDANKVHKKILRNTTDLMDVRIFHRDRDRTAIHNPCAINNGNCSHICLLNSKGYACACPIGVLLQNDTKTCNNGSSKYIIMAHRIDIRQISLDVDYIIDVVLPLPSISNAMAIDVDIFTGDIYWSDSFDDVIRRSTPDGIHGETIIIDDLDSVDGLIIDVIGRKLYWTDGGRQTIEVSEMNGNNREILIWNDLESPRGLAIDYEEGLLFWTDWGISARIERAHMDGEKRDRIVTARLGWPNCLAAYDKRLYWTDARTKYIESCDYLGNLREIIMKDLLHPYGIAVTNNIIYWTDWKNKSLMSMSNVKGASANRKTIKTDLDGLMDIKIIETNKELPKNVCANNNGNCSHLCLRNADGYTCKCPIGINLRKDNNYTCNDLPDIAELLETEANYENVTHITSATLRIVFSKYEDLNYLLVALRAGISRISLDTPELFDFVLPIDEIHGAVVLDYHYNLSTIYYADVITDVIRMVDMKNMSNTKDIISDGLNTTNGLAVDWIANNLYWSDSALKVIEVSRLDGTSRKVILKENLNDPRSIIIYPKRGLIFWSDWGDPPRIERAAMDGSNRKIIIESNLGFPTGLAIDFDTRRLYWADSLRDRIEMSDFNGDHRINVVSNPKHPFGITIYKSNIYWTDWYNKTVSRSSKNSSLFVDKLRNTLRGALDIRSVSDIRQPHSNNPCAENNGGCSHLCLYIGRTYVCACPDKFDQRICRTVPDHLVTVTDDSLSEYIDEIVPTNVFINNNQINESSTSFSSYITYAIVIVSIILILVVTIMLALGLHTRYKKRDKRSGSGSCSFSNPNYNVSSMGNLRPSDSKCKFWCKYKSERPQVSQMMRMDNDYMEPCMAEVDILPKVSIHNSTSSPKPMQSSSKTIPLSIIG